MLQDLANFAKELNENDDQLTALVDNGLSIVDKLLKKINNNNDTSAIAKNIASLTKMMYDQFRTEGFSSEQATAFTSALLGKGKK